MLRARAAAISSTRNVFGSRRIATGSPITDQKLKNKVALITGGASGIGAAAARLFAAHGARVVIADIQDEAGLGMKRELDATYVHCDVRVESHVASAIDVAQSLTGHVDVVFANAGIVGALGPLDGTNVDELAVTMDVNLRGSFLALKHAARVMKPLGSGSVLLTGSVSSVVGGLGPHAYAMCKAGLGGLVRSAAVELREYGIRVNMVSPDAVATPLLAAAIGSVSGDEVSVGGAADCVAKQSLLRGRWLTPQDIAAAALFLASDDAAYISGHNLVVDAGNSVSKPADAHNWFTTYSPMLREGGKRGI